MTTDNSADVASGRFVPHRRVTLAEAELDGDVVIYDDAGDAMHILNSSAALIWQSLDGKATVDDLVEDFVDLTGSPRETIRADLVATLASFLDRNLLARQNDERDEERTDEADYKPSSQPQGKLRVIGPAPST